MAEIWKPIPGHEGAYEASDLGRVRSLDRVTDRGRRWKGRLMTPCPLPNDYLIVTLWRDGRQRTPLVHRLVLLTFVGPAPAGTEALHADGDRSNNRLDNLSWGTHSQNQYDQVAHGTHFNASKTHCRSGHPYTPENTYLRPRGGRACRTCRARWVRETKERMSQKEVA